MKPEDQQAFEDAYEAYSLTTLHELDGCKWTSMQLFKAALAHRDAQASAINEQILNALKMVLDDPKSLDGRPRTAECVMEAIAAAAEANKGTA